MLQLHVFKQIGHCILISTFGVLTSISGFAEGTQVETEPQVLVIRSLCRHTTGTLIEQGQPGYESCVEQHSRLQQKPQNDVEIEEGTSAPGYPVPTRVNFNN